MIEGCLAGTEGENGRKNKIKANFLITSGAVEVHWTKSLRK